MKFVYRHVDIVALLYNIVIVNNRIEAYSDRPFRNNFIHISAPHIYVTVLVALDLNQGQAFLNIGSGSGYLSCIASCLLGEGGVSHGIDINEEVISHSKKCCSEW